MDKTHTQARLRELMLTVRDMPDKDCYEWQTAAEAFYNATHKFLYKLLHNFGADPRDIADITQETYLKIFKARKSYDETKSSVLTWIGKILVNTWINYAKKATRINKNAAGSMDDEKAVQMESPYSVAGQAVSRATLHGISQYLAVLKKQDDGQNRMVQRVLAFQLCKWNAWSYKEISHALGVPESTVTNWIYRMTADVRNHFDSAKV